METSRRNLIGVSMAAAGAAAMPRLAFAQQTSAPALRSLTGGAAPISREERLARIARAQRLMRQQGLSALLIEPGASLVYFTGVRWGRSERLTAAIIPAEGEIAIVTPHFEEPSVRETLAVPGDVRVWHEHQDPLTIVAGFLKDRKAAAGPVGIEETVRFFAVDGLAKALPRARIVNGASVVRGCRMVKSPAELRLMQLANDVTLAAYRHTWPRVQKGMSPRDISAMMSEATTALGGTGSWNLILLGEASAYPHGTRKPQEVKEGEVVLMDCGCSVEDYQSDISRTFVFGESNAEQRKVWDQVRRGQEIAFAAARVGRPAGSVDDAVRAQYERWGYGPDYELPGLSHRTGHGIGMEGHEPINLVRGEKTPLAPGMCFSNEPGLYFPGKFGVRLEDCFYMTESGPRWFTTPPPSLDRPLG